jgi:hypothetical protein
VRRSLQIAAILVVCAIAVWLVSDRPALQIDVERGGHAFVRGTFSKTVLPETIYVHLVGSHTVIRIANRDTVRHHLGLFDVDAGKTSEFTIAYAGVFGGFCSAHPTSKQLVYVVE